MAPRLLLLLGGLTSCAHTLDNGVGRTPQMGWNSWYSQWMTPTEAHAHATAAALLANGLQSAGYSTITIDDGWSTGRDANNTLVASPAQFPSGMAALGAFLHGQGFSFGMYTDRGTAQCGSYPGTGSQGFEASDAAWFVGVNDIDYLKEDSCSASSDPETAYAQYALMRDSLAAASVNRSRAVFFALCGWEAWYAPVGHALGNSWRIGTDDNNIENVLQDIDVNAGLAAFAGPGGWNDPCLLLGVDASGVELITEAQSRMQFSMWATMASPLILSQDVTNMSASRLATYSNTEVIAIDQDVLGRQGVRVVGGPVSLSRLHADGPPVTSQPCASPPASSQQWVMNNPMPGYLSSVANASMCMNVDECGDNVIAFPCVTSGGTCCGANCYDNMRFNFSAVGVMQSVLSGQCVTASIGAGATATTVRCGEAAGQAWSYDAIHRIVTDGQGNCLTIGAGGGNGTRANVWARPLADGAYAFTFFNMDPAPVTLQCGVACMAVTGWLPGQQLAVRDVWAHADMGLTTPAVGINATLDADGGVAMYRVTPMWYNASSIPWGLRPR